MLKKVIISCIVSFSIICSSFYSPLLAAKAMEKNDMSQLNAKGAVLMDAASGSIILEKDSYEKLPIASVTKVMSMLLIMEAIDSGKIKFEDTVPISPTVASFGGSQLWLDVRESNKYTVDEILKGIAIHSANDGTVAIAEMIAGSEEGFVGMMNDKAKELCLDNTNFVDCTGLTDDGHYSCAHDIAVMSRELIEKHPKILEYTSIRRDKFGEGKRAKPTDLDNTNQLIGKYEGMIGLKTGFTNKAGYNLSAVANRNNMKFIAVVLGEPDSNTRFTEIKKLLDYGFANFEISLVNKKGDEAGMVEIKKGMQSTAKTIIPYDVNLLINKGNKQKIVSETRFEENITAPVDEGQKVGQMLYYIDGEEIGKADIVIENKVEKASPVRLFFRMIMQWFGLGRK